MTREFRLKLPPHTAFIFFSFLWTSSISAVEYIPQVAEVVSVYDGDTFWLRFPTSQEDSDIEYAANLIGVDAPGDGEAECAAHEATSFAKRLLEGKTLWIEWDTQDKQTNNGRLLVYISRKDDHFDDLNATFLEQGWGWVPRKFPADRKEIYLKLEEQARKERKGLWAYHCAPNL